MENQLDPLESYYASLPLEYGELFLFLREYISEFDKRISEHFKWKCPFFYFEGKPFCFLNYTKKNPKIYIGFTPPGLLKSEPIDHPALISGGRKMLRIFPLDIEEDLDLDLLKEILKLLQEKVCC